MAVRWKKPGRGQKMCAARRCPKRLLFAKSRGRINAGNPEGRHYRGKQSYGSQNDDHNGQGRGVVDADPVKHAAHYPKAGCAEDESTGEANPSRSYARSANVDHDMAHARTEGEPDADLTSALRHDVGHQRENP